MVQGHLVPCSLGTCLLRIEHVVWTALNFLNKILNLFNSGSLSRILLLVKSADLNGNVHCHIEISAPPSLSSLEDSVSDLLNIKRDFSAVSFNNMDYHCP